MWAWGLPQVVYCHLAISDTVTAPGVFDRARRPFFKMDLAHVACQKQEEKSREGEHNLH